MRSGLMGYYPDNQAVAQDIRTRKGAFGKPLFYKYCGSGTGNQIHNLS
jgi:hypothetical protein